MILCPSQSSHNSGIIAKYWGKYNFYQRFSYPTCSQMPLCF